MEEIQESIGNTVEQTVDERPVEVILDSSKNKKQSDGTVQIVQARQGLFVVVEYHDGEAKMKYPKLMSLCQLCGNDKCKHNGKVKPFTKCTIRVPLCPSEINTKFGQLMHKDIEERMLQQGAAEVSKEG